MFYIFEIIHRLKYSFFAYCFLIVFCYKYYPIFFSFLDHLFKGILNGEQANTSLNYYIYTHPFELYYTHILFCFVISLHFIIPYLIWQFIDFSKTAFYISEYKFLIGFLCKSLLVYFICYTLLYSYIIPSFLDILQISKKAYFSEMYSVFFELKIQDFIYFIIYLNSVFTIIITFLIFLSLFIFKFSLSNIIKIKKLIYLIAIIFSTFVSPPDIVSQIILFLLILISVELIVFLRILNYYLFVKKSNNY